MKKLLVFSLLSIPFCTVIGCSNLGQTETGALGGTALGAGLGAIIGHETGHTGAGIAIGTAAGALSGGLLGSQAEKQDVRTRDQDERLRRQEEEMRRQQRELDELRRQQGGDTTGSSRSGYDSYDRRDTGDSKY